MAYSVSESARDFAAWRLQRSQRVVNQAVQKRSRSITPSAACAMPAAAASARQHPKMMCQCRRIAMPETVTAMRSTCGPVYTVGELQLGESSTFRSIHRTTSVTNIRPVAVSSVHSPNIRMMQITVEVDFDARAHEAGQGKPYSGAQSPGDLQSAKEAPTNLGLMRRFQKDRIARNTLFSVSSVQCRADAALAAYARRACGLCSQG